MSSCQDSGQFIRHKTTGKVGVTGIDPYGICGHDEVSITFCGDSKDPDKWLGNGFPMSEWEVIQRDKVSRYYQKKFGHLVH